MSKAKITFQLHGINRFFGGVEYTVFRDGAPIAAGRVDSDAPSNVGDVQALLAMWPEDRPTACRFCNATPKTPGCDTRDHDRLRDLLEANYCPPYLVDGAPGEVVIQSDPGSITVVPGLGAWKWSPYTELPRSLTDVPLHPSSDSEEGATPCR